MKIHVQKLWMLERLVQHVCVWWRLSMLVVNIHVNDGCQLGISDILLISGKSAD